MIDEETANVIAEALWNDGFTGLDGATLDELAVFEFWDDPDVEFVELDFTEEAGIYGHGINTEEEMMHTLDIAIDVHEPTIDEHSTILDKVRTTLFERRDS